MTNYDVIKKLVGHIQPTAESHYDDVRFENLKEMCSLVEQLLTDIHDMQYRTKDYQEYSMKRSVEYAQKFLKETVLELIKDV